MAKTINQAILDIAEAMPDVSVYENYSGRAMFNRTCVGFVLDRHLHEVAFFGRMLQELDENDAHDALHDLAEMMQNARSDQMGLGLIVYFPDFQYPL